MSYTQQAILRDKNGDAIPQIWDVTQNKFVPYTNDDIKLLQSELETIKTNQLSGDQKVQLPGSENFAKDLTIQEVTSELELVKAELQTIKTNQLSGDQKVQLSGAISSESNPLITSYRKSPTSGLEFNSDVSGDIAYESWLSFPEKKLISRGASRLLPYSDLETWTRVLPSFDITTLQGTIRHVHKTPLGVAYITSDINANETYFYYASDLDATPTLKETYVGGYALTMSCASWFDNIHDVILVGIYGQDKDPSSEKPLYLSTDGGQTWGVITQTTIINTTDNSHWHSCSFDPYQGRIWAAEGDGENRALNWSDDFGKTWSRMIGEHQPTLIQPFASRVVFGEDASSSPPGLYGYHKLQTNHNVELYRALSFRDDQGANWNYPEGPSYPNPQVGYVLFTPKTEPLNDMQYIYATGDGGTSWHCVWSASREFARIEKLLYVPAENKVIARLRTHYSHTVNELVYANAVSWE
jgi:hypothetical protein